ncbi:MAG: DUF2254 domain-containing protein [Novosphingobium sp.]|nr:DUF2254 domain-containing protein [Novosphingobium sp.]
MFARFRSVLFSIRASYWFYPALFAAIGFALALELIHLDRIGAADWMSEVEILHPARPQGASNMLTVLAGSMIGVASTVFSITIAAVAYASGTYGPRLLTNFMEDKGNQLSLATFIGTFVYALTVLRSVRAEDEVSIFAQGSQGDALPGFVPQLSLLVAFGLMIVSVAVLVYFLHHIPSSIRINAVLEGIGRRLLRKIRDRYPEENSGAAARERDEGEATIHADDTGYIRFMDLDSLNDLGERHETTIMLDVRTGDFIHPGVPLARLASDANADDLAHELRDCFAVGASRTPEQDLEFSMDELVEIALRALSPGINDPFTAITAVHWLGAATAELGARDLIHDEAKRKWIVPLEDDFAHFLARGFGAARSAIASSRLAALVTFDALVSVGLTLEDESRLALVVREADLFLAQAEKALTGPDLDEVRARHAASLVKLRG